MGFPPRARRAVSARFDPSPKRLMRARQPLLSRRAASYHSPGFRDVVGRVQMILAGAEMRVQSKNVMPPMESPSVAGKALFVLLSSRAAIWEVLQARRRACLVRSVDATEPAGTV